MHYIYVYNTHMSHKSLMVRLYCLQFFNATHTLGPECQHTKMALTRKLCPCLLAFILLEDATVAAAGQKSSATASSCATHEP